MSGANETPDKMNRRHQRQVAEFCQDWRTGCQTVPGMIRLARQIKAERALAQGGEG